MNKYSEERKKLQAMGEIPDWFITPGYQLFIEKYLWASSVKEQYKAIAREAASYVNNRFDEGEAYNKFFNLLWKGWLSPSTPILANMGTTRGLPISCSGGYIGDSIDGFYTARREAAILTKHGFGTSGYLGDIRPRGSDISIGGKASGVLPVFKGFVRDMEEVAQGTNRRGAWAGYLPITHGDFDELCNYLLMHPDGLNVGWNIPNYFIDDLNNGSAEALRRYQKALKTKMVTGKGYFFFVDKANEQKPYSYKTAELDILASNLCTEIMLPSNEDYTFTCVLSSMNVAKFDEWQNTDAVYWSTVFLDAVATSFIDKARWIPGLENAVRFTEEHKALGLGQCGLHTYLQGRGIPFESLEARWESNEIARIIQLQAIRADRDMYDYSTQPIYCDDETSHTHLIAIAPTKSTALIMGGISEGINPDPAVVFGQNTSAGEVERITPVFLNLMKQRGVYDKGHIREIEDAFGSVQGVSWLTPGEKLVFKTAFEMDMKAIIRMASSRQQYVDQGQSINLFFAGDATEEYISKCHKMAFNDPNILSLYYCYSKAGVSGSKEECVACQ